MILIVVRLMSLSMSESGAICGIGERNEGGAQARAQGPRRWTGTGATSRAGTSGRRASYRFSGAVAKGYDWRGDRGTGAAGGARALGVESVRRDAERVWRPRVRALGETMRVYHLLAEHWAVCDLQRKRLKVARFDELNDPFELLGVELGDHRERRLFDRWKAETAATFGLLCFSKGWRNPVLWSHYADRHRGMCLGFDVSDECLQEVRYLPDRWNLADYLPERHEAGPLFSTKFATWAYEEEYRRIVRLDDAEDDGAKRFWPFGDDLQLREVVVGPRCRIGKERLRRILGRSVKGVKLKKARLAFKTFSVVCDRRGLR